MEKIKRKNQKLWEKIVDKVKKEGNYGSPGTWNARKAQHAVLLYKEFGGKYLNRKTGKDSLSVWTKQKWRYSDEKMKGKGRYLPDKAWKILNKKEKDLANKSKIIGTKKKIKYVKEPERVERKIKKFYKEMEK